jgi:hypothetical protein
VRSPAFYVFSVALVVGTATRLYLAAAYLGNTDERAWELFAGVVGHGGNLFTDPDIPQILYYAYSPVWAWILRGVQLIGEATDLPMHFVLRGMLTFVDLGNATLIGIIARRISGWSWQRGFATYYLNPVAILLVGFHGQVEPLAAFPLLLAVVVAERWTALRGSATGLAVWVLGTLSLLFKHILAFQVWALYWYAFSPLRRLAFVVASAFAFGLTVLPYYLDAPGAVTFSMLGHKGLPWIYGFGTFLPQPIAILMFFVALTTLPLLAQRWGLPLAYAMRLSALTFLTFTYGIGEQYFLIPVLFGAAMGGRWYWVYSAVAGLFLVSSFENVHLLTLPRLWNAVWLAVLVWTIAVVIEEIRAARRRPAAHTAR